MPTSPPSARRAGTASRVGSGGIAPRAARSQIASAINIVIQIERLIDGHRKVVSISELSGMEGDTITMQEIFRYKATGRAADGTVIGHFEATGIRPKFLADSAAYGITRKSSGPKCS